MSWVDASPADMDSIPKDAGVYAVYLDGGLAYIGRAFCLKYRIPQHNLLRAMVKGEWKRRKFSRLTLKVRTARVAEVEELEKKLIRRLTPSLNVALLPARSKSRNGRSMPSEKREFPWMAECDEPAKANEGLLASCESAGMAALISVRIGCRGTDSWVAKRLGISRSYLSEILSGAKPVPEWMPVPLAYLTGTWLLRQYLDLQDALAAVSEESPKQRAERLAREYLRAAA